MSATPISAAMQWVCVVLGAYLATVATLRVVARVARLRPLLRVADAVTLRMLRRVAAVLTGLAVGIPAAARADTTTTDAPVVMHRLPATTASEATTTSTSLPTAITVPPVPSPKPRADTTWRVQPGQNLWGIAAAALHDAWGRNPTAAEVVPYWRQLIEANRSRLRDPANPNLIYPGQEFDLPPR